MFDFFQVCDDQVQFSYIYGTGTWRINSLRPRQNGCHFPDDIFKWIFLNENVWISITISLKFVPNVPINNIPALVQKIMAWRRPGDKPLSEPMMVSLPTHKCVTRPQWANTMVCQIHGDVIKWKHVPRHWPFVRGIRRWPVDSPYKGQWRGALAFSLICTWTNDWANNRVIWDSAALIITSLYCISLVCVDPIMSSYLQMSRRYYGATSSHDDSPHCDCCFMWTISHKTQTAKRQTMVEEDRGFGNPFVSLLWEGSHTKKVMRRIKPV